MELIGAVITLYSTTSFFGNSTILRIPSPDYTEVALDVGSQTLRYLGSEPVVNNKELRDASIVARITTIDSLFEAYANSLSTVDFVIEDEGSGHRSVSAFRKLSGGEFAAKVPMEQSARSSSIMPSIIDYMRAERRKSLGPIYTGLKKSIDDYSWHDALEDVETYYRAGTIDGVLDAIRRDARAKEEAASRVLDISHLPEAATLLASQPIRDKVRALQKKIDALSDDQAIALAKNPPVADGALAPALLGRFPTKAWETDPAAARAALKFRVTLMINPAVDLPEWDKVLP